MSKSEFLQIENHVSEKVTKYFSEHPKFIVGVSGGADSMALLFALKQLNLDAFVVHVNYGLRGEESDKDQELVEGLAFEWGFECCSVRIDSSQSENENFQNWAREERYRIFSELMEETGANGLVVAHHRDDQVETIMQKILRGSSPEAWSGMTDWDGEIFRPFLAFNKSDILKYCKERAIPFRTDKSNLESNYSRNFLRNEFSDKMDILFPGWDANILKLQEFGRLNELAISELLDQNKNKFELPIQRIREFDKILAQAVIKKFLNNYIPSLSEGMIKEAYNLIESQTGSELRLTDFYTLIKDRDQLIIKEKSSSFKAIKVTKKMLVEGFQSNELDLSIVDKRSSELYLDADRLQFPLVIRRWEAGDKIQPLGLKGSQKISDHLTNRKVSAAKKEKSLVLSNTDGTIYAIIFEAKQTKSGTISEICKVTDTTKQFLLITPKNEA